MDTSIIELRDRLALIFIEKRFSEENLGEQAYLFADEVLEQRVKKAEKEMTIEAKMRKVAYTFAKYAGLEPEQALELMQCAKERWLPTYENLTTPK